MISALVEGMIPPVLTSELELGSDGLMSTVEEEDGCLDCVTVIVAVFVPVVDATSSFPSSYRK